MTKSVTSPPLPAPLAALERAFAPDGASSLDPEVPAALWRRALVGPAGEFLARPGKALRATIVRAGWMLGGGARDGFPERLAAVLELIHAGSLIVDDVEDDSLERRGGPALHCIVGMPLAINTGSWMYFYGLAELAEVCPQALPTAVATLVRCHQGQALDLAARVTEVPQESIAGVVKTVTRLKTGALCRLAAELGAIAAGADPERCEAIARFAEQMGIGLQMLDDLGSIVAPSRSGKALEDLRGLRPTWPWAWLDAWEPAVELARAGDHAALIEMLATTEPRGRAQIRATLDDALAELRTAVGANPVIDQLARELARMETHYG